MEFVNGGSCHLHKRDIFSYSSDVKNGKKKWALCGNYVGDSPIFLTEHMCEWSLLVSSENTGAQVQESLANGTKNH